MTELDLIHSHRDLFARIERKARWKIATPMQRVVATILAAVPLDDPFAELERAATTLRRESGWFGPLASPLRWCVAALTLRRGLAPEAVHDGVVDARGRMKGRGLPRLGPGRTLAAVLIALRHGGAGAPSRVFERMERIHRLWRAEHPWLTDGNDLPLVAFHALGEEGPEPLSARVEGIYRALRDQGRPRGNALQLASHILAALPWSPREAGARFGAIERAFVGRGERVGRSLYDEVALLALLPDPAAALVREILGDRDRLREERPRPGKELALGIATGIALARRAAAARASSDLPELSAVEQARAILEAEQAASIILMNSSFVAISASSASSR